MKCKYITTYIVIIGEPINGFSFAGPFKNYEDAYNYTESRGISIGSWIGCCHAPMEEDNE